jgi:endonuclease/exonuclease/phosphatase family metal-dependent hydrolase
VLRLHETYDEFTSCCAELDTEYGKLNVYGTILGVFGNRCDNFKVDLPKQIEDFVKFSQDQKLCIAGDFNISFTDNYYYTKSGRDELNKCFEKAGLVNLTASLKWNIDHIAISKDILNESEIDLYEWNVDKAVSDHKGVGAKIKVEIQAENKLAHNIG